ETKHGGSKNGKKEGLSGSSFFTWFMVIALLGVWTSVAVVWFELVDYEEVLAKAKDFRYNLSEVLQGKLGIYDADGDGDFDVEDAKVLLGKYKYRWNNLYNLVGMFMFGFFFFLKAIKESLKKLREKQESKKEENEEERKKTRKGKDATDRKDKKAVDMNKLKKDSDKAKGDRGKEKGLDKSVKPKETTKKSSSEKDGTVHVGKDKETKKITRKKRNKQSSCLKERSVPAQPASPESEETVQPAEKSYVESAKKKKPKLLNKFDKTIKAELDAAEKLRKKGKVEEALRAFEALVNQYPQSPRARYGKAQSEDDLAEKMRSNEMLQQAINTYDEVVSLPNVPSDLIKLSLKREADRQQFLGRMRGSLVTLQKLVQLFPSETSFKNDLGVGYLLIGDDSNAKKVYEEVLSLAPNDGFAKVHYGFILKAENKIAESIPYLQEGLESGDPGTDDGRFYFHLGDALQRMGDKEAYKWYELGYQRGHFASVWQRSLYNVKGLKAQPWWTARETGYTELVKSLEKNWKLIRDEGLAVMDKKRSLFLPEDENLREKGDWSQFTLWQQGRKNENACKSVPKTCALLERFPEATGCRRGQIKYSIMHPGTHVWPHTGPTNCRLRMHLGLVIPKEGCRIRCAQENRDWEEGKVLIFDDSFEHEVWQDAESYRLIFIVDVWHPELTAQQRRTLPAI
ncbi:ASPH hydroxylase, partial [Aphelocoma coerulescens]|nr:ASPH hydroxylase [Aphelocoma coerulescens]